MKSFTSKKWLVVCLCFFLVIGQGAVLWAQEDAEEEEEELVQTRPNPMENSAIKGRGLNSTKGHFGSKQSQQKTQMRQQTGKAMSNRVQSGQAAHSGAAMKQPNSMR